MSKQQMTIAKLERIEPTEETRKRGDAFAFRYYTEVSYGDRTIKISTVGKFSLGYGKEYLELGFFPLRYYETMVDYEGTWNWAEINDDAAPTAHIETLSETSDDEARAQHQAYIDWAMIVLQVDAL
jgi:hypothetical protein